MPATKGTAKPVLGRPDKQQFTSVWLRGFLAAGSRPAKEVYREAKNVGISPATLNRARFLAGVETIRQGKGCIWRDPGVLEDQKGTPTLCAAMQEQARAIRELTRALRQITKPGAVGFTAISGAAAEPLDDGVERWTEKEYEGSSYIDIVALLERQQEALAEAKKWHGHRYEADRFHEAYTVDNSLTVLGLEKEIPRTEAWIEKKRPAGRF